MDEPKELSFLCRNAVEVISKEELAARLKKKPLRIKAGFDPSAPDIHLGHTVLLRKLREFQDLGHRVVFIIGDYTALVGDPTGQVKTRPQLSKDQIEENAKTYQAQVFKILDKSPEKVEVVCNSKWLADKSPEKVEVVCNSKWLAGPEMFRVLFQEIGPHVTVDQLLVREDFNKRKKAHRPIAFRELIYPILQGYDSVMIKSDIELGGTDQTFNLLMGRDLQSKYGQKPQVVMTLPLLVGLDGQQKMSKSYGNHIGVMDSPKDMFGKTMSIPDALMESWYSLLTPEKLDENLHPREAKIRLAKLIVGWLYDKDTADQEAKEFDRIFSKKLDPLDPKTVSTPFGEIDPTGLLKHVKAVNSSSEAYRLIQQGAVTLDGQKVTDPKASLKLKNGSFLKVGKKKVFKLIVTNS
ncbi:MAG: tyrosine--tRNA ligase [Candidatus Omnitrophica bacterium]|nr:tyrosine--tRNA ligase [Candidatus Omnitrophota bacterium]